MLLLPLSNRVEGLVELQLKVSSCCFLCCVRCAAGWAGGCNRLLACHGEWVATLSPDGCWLWPGSGTSSAATLPACSARLLAFLPQPSPPFVSFVLPPYPPAVVLQVLFPVEMYIRVYRPSRRMFWLLESINLLCLIVTVVAVAGSVQQIVVDASSYKMFS